jgi:hypothetical protein
MCRQELGLETFNFLFYCSAYFSTVFIPLSHFLELNSIVPAFIPCSSAGFPCSQVGSAARTLSIFHIACNSFPCLCAKCVIHLHTHCPISDPERGRSHANVSTTLIPSIRVNSVRPANALKKKKKIFWPTFFVPLYVIHRNTAEPATTSQALLAR